jgi:hypothetical protein
VKRVVVAGVVVGAALVAPAAALAHVGTSPPVATNFAAHITRAAPGVEARVVDGDQTLWLLVTSPTMLLVPGVEGEPLLRFDSRGVWVNRHSLTAETDRIDRFDLKPLANPRARPLWHRLTGGHAYAWHEHRLHLFEPLAAAHHSAAQLGAWTVPLIIDGQRHELAGVLDYRPPPPRWVWVAASVLLAAATAAAAWRRQRPTVALALAATLLVWVLRIGRELYGRPTVGATGWLELALTSVVGVALLYGLLHRDEAIRTFTAFLVGFGGLYQGLTMAPVLTHSIALTVLPTSAARVAVAVTLGLSAGALVGGWHGLLNERGQPERIEPLKTSAA